MTLNCSAGNCIYNNSGICYAGNIEVHGTKATYLLLKLHALLFISKDKGNSLSNNTSNTFTTSTDIHCKAKKCNYNSNQTCTAPSVQINYNNASCDTFILQK